MSFELAYSILKTRLTSSENKTIDIPGAMNEAYGQFVTGSFMLGMGSYMVDRRESEKREFFKTERPNFLRAAKLLAVETGVDFVLE